MRHWCGGHGGTIEFKGPGHDFDIDFSTFLLYNFSGEICCAALLRRPPQSIALATIPYMLATCLVNELRFQPGDLLSATFKLHFKNSRPASDPSPSLPAQSVCMWQNTISSTSRMQSSPIISFNVVQSFEEALAKQPSVGVGHGRAQIAKNISKNYGLGRPPSLRSQQAIEAVYM
eukprot:5779655-Pleurochrysis_carterae.AAC.1